MRCDGHVHEGGASTIQHELREACIQVRCLTDARALERVCGRHFMVQP
jgi:hypothetical protein